MNGTNVRDASRKPESCELSFSETPRSRLPHEGVAIFPRSHYEKHTQVDLSVNVTIVTNVRVTSREPVSCEFSISKIHASRLP